MDFNKALASVMDGNCILFLGAGFSLGAKTFLGNEVLTSAALARELCALINKEQPGSVEVTNDLQYAADDYIDLIRDPDKVVTTLTSYLKVKSVGKHHESIAQMPWKYVYTTNFDNTYELACTNIGKSYRYATLRDNLRSLPVNENVILHINGMIESLNKANLTTDFKLTNESYLTNEFINSPWFDKFTRDVKNSDAIFMTGYSLYDIDIKRIFHENAELKDKTFFIIGDEKISENRLKRITEKFGVFTGIDTEKFSKALDDARRHCKPKVQVASYPSFSCETKEFRKEIRTSITGDDVFKLFVYGDLDKDLLYHDIHGNGKPEYYIQRDEAKKILSDIENGIQNIIVKSDFGNGKTLLFEGIIALCIQKNIPCLKLEEQSDLTGREIDSITKSTNRQVVFIDDCRKYRDTIKQFSQHRADNTILVLADRTSVLDGSKNKISSLLTGATKTYIIDSLDGEAVDSVVSILERNGFWGELSEKSYSEKIDRIRTEYKSSIAGILLGILKSKEIQRRLTLILDELTESAIFKDLITVTCIFNIIHEPINLSDIFRILNCHNQNKIVLETNHSIRQIFDCNTYSISAKSPIFSSYLLKEHLTHDYIVDILLKVYEFCAKSKRIPGPWKDAVYELSLFSRIQAMLPERNSLSFVQRYFEGIKEQNTKNFHFWFQYAIAMTTLGDFEMASVYFKTAYSLHGKDRYGETHMMLENHYARFLLKRVCSNTYPIDEAFGYFENASAIVHEQIYNDKALAFPYKNAVLYDAFHKKYSDLFSERQRAAFFSCTKEIVSIISKMDRQISRSRDVVDAWVKLNELLQKEND